MVQETRLLLIKYNDSGDKGFIEVQPHHTFAHVRNLLHEEWDVNMLPPPGYDFYFCKYDHGTAIRINKRDERLINVWEFTAVQDLADLPVGGITNLPFVSIQHIREPASN
jgi:hypothetical protein